MAKSKSFFGLRRGSTKSHTYSVLNGQQITKDRVQSVANPKTQKQQFQRAIMATVMAAYSEMKAIEDHAFQGKKKGSENQREFLSRNLVAMRNAFLQYQSESTVPASQKFFAVGPKTPTVLPCEWIISQGTLDEQTAFTLIEEYFEIARVRQYTEQSGGLTATLGGIAEDLGLVPGMQITFLCINAKNGPRIFEVDPAMYAGYHDYKFGYCRLVVGNFDPTEKIGISTNSKSDLLQAFFAKILDNKSTPQLVDALTSQLVDEEDDDVTIDANSFLAGARFDETLTRGVGIITSMANEDLRSTSKMTVRPWLNNDPSIGLTWNYVPLAWQKGAEGLGESDLYLEGGE